MHPLSFQNHDCATFYTKERQSVCLFNFALPVVLCPSGFQYHDCAKDSLFVCLLVYVCTVSCLLLSMMGSGMRMRADSNIHPPAQ